MFAISSHKLLFVYVVFVSLVGRIRTKSEPLNCLFYTIEIVVCCVLGGSLQ